MERLEAVGGGAIPHAHGVIREAALSEARGVAAFRQRAQLSIERDAEQARLDALVQAQVATRAAEEAVWCRAAELLGALEQARESLAMTAAPFVLRLTRSALAHLAVSIPPQAQLNACIALALKDARAGTRAVLKVNPAQTAHAMPVLAHLDDVQLQGDESVSPGECELVVDGCMTTQVSFAANLASLSRAVLGAGSGGPC